MYAFATIAFALAATAVALPQQGGSGHEGKGSSITVEQAQNQCNGGTAQQVSCCTSESTDGLLSILDDLSILGGDCSPVAVNVGILASIQNEQVGSQCNGNQVACCPAGTSVSSPLLSNLFRHGREKILTRNHRAPPPAALPSKGTVFKTVMALTTWGRLDALTFRS